jgi:ubiquinol-cytochrome c reductase cytochrome b subunit
LFFLHEYGSNNPIGIASRLDYNYFSPFYTLKDTFSLILIFLPFFYIIFYSPDILGHPVNYDIANPLVTPVHIVPE